MKRNILYILIFVFYLLNIKCSPDLDFDNFFQDDNIGQTVTIKVKEYKTNLPISGAKFSTYYCTGFDQYIGCTEKILLSSCITDNNGICNCIFPEKSFEEIIIEKSMYWTKRYRQIENTNEYIIQPEAWVSVNFKTDVVYPSTSTFSIRINGELKSVQEYVQETNISNKVFTLFGNEENKVSWTLLGNSEILNSGNFTLHPNKFENLEYTLNY